MAVTAAHGALEGSTDNEAAGIKNGIDFSDRTSPSKNMTTLLATHQGGDQSDFDGDDKAHGIQSPPHMMEVTAPDVNSPITNLYLTFDTLLPASKDAGSDELPPCPDLTRYTDPHKWPSSRKNVMLFICCVATGLTAYTAGSYSPPAELLAAEFGVSKTAALVGVTTFTTGFALAPMTLAPLSEINGRYPVFVIAGIIFVVFQVICGVVPDLAGMLVARFITGCGGSVFSTMVGGVIADLWPKEKRNTPMALFSGAVLMGTGVGPLDASVMVQRLGAEGPTGVSAPWRWIFWHQVIADAILVAAVAVWFHESRACVLLSRRAKTLNSWYDAMEKQGSIGVWMPHEEEHLHAVAGSDPAGQAPPDEEKGLPGGSLRNTKELASRGYRLQRIRWLVKEDEQRASITKMIATSLLRPFHLLFTEPVVFFFSLWVSFAWAILYLTFGSIPLVFETQYNFSTEQSGYVFSAMIVGAVLATIIGIYQENVLKHPQWQRKTASDENQHPPSAFWSLMRRRFPVEAPESRLYFTCLTSILLPLGLYLFGFSSQPSIHWIVPTIAIGFATMGIYYIYLATFNYLADSYHSYASSALAAQSFCRNILAGAFPLVVTPLFTNLGDGAAGGLLGAIATVLTVVPWVLAFFGERIRRRSKLATALEHE